MRLSFIALICFNLTQPIAVTADYYDWEWNSGGTIDCVPTYGATWDGWGEWTITTLKNDNYFGVYIIQFGFPCNYGDGSGPNQDVWCALWYNVGGLHAPPGDFTSADEYFDFDPVDGSGASPPTIYSYVDIPDTEFIFIPKNSYFSFGYKNPGLIGLIGFNGNPTWSWDGQSWYPDGKKGRTAVLQVRAHDATGIATTSLGTIKVAFK